MIIIEKNYNLNYYKDVFSLKNSWEDNITPIILLIKAMSFLKDKVDLGYLIAKQEIIIKNLDFSKIHLKALIEQNKKTSTMSYLICNCMVCKKQEILIELKSTLIKKTINNLDDKIANNDKNINLSDENFFRVITKKEVYRFSQISKDPNYIHRTEKPVVQAMLILLILEDYLALRKIYMYNCKITYITPLLADKKLFLHWYNSNILIGISQNKICFKLVLHQN